MNEAEEELIKVCKLLSQLEAYSLELRDSLKDYQARYHGKPHAQKKWDEADIRLKAYDQFIEELHRTSAPPG